MKGAFVAAAAYPNFAARAAGQDDDCWLQVDDLAALLGQGWQAGVPGRGLASQRQLRQAWIHGGEVALRDPAGGPDLDVHRQPGYGLPVMRQAAQAVLQQTTEVEVAGARLPDFVLGSTGGAVAVASGS